MDKVVQSSAATAEETASASEELNAQAEQMNEIVRELQAIVAGRGSNGGDVRSAQTVTQKTGRERAGARNRKALPGSAKNGREHAATKQIGYDDSPQKLIPLDSSEFKDF